MKKVILDTDTYNEADDQFALSYLLKSKDTFDIKAITIAPFKHEKYTKNISDSIDDSYNEACKILDYLAISDKSIIYKGSRNYMRYNPEISEAVNKIIEISLKYDEVYFLAIGCLTNLALAIKEEPKIIKKLKVIWLGTNFLYGSNMDFNFSQDVEAVKYVFDSKVDLTIIPCSPISSNLMTSIYELKAEIGGKNELCDFLCDRFYNRVWGPTKRYPIWDISVVAYLINNNWFNTIDISCPIIKDDNTFILTTDKHNIKFACYLDASKIYSDLFQKLKETSK